MRRLTQILLFAASILLSQSLFAADNLTLTVENPDSWLVVSPEKHTIEITVSNNGTAQATEEVSLYVMTDVRDYVADYKQNVTISPGSSATVTFNPELPAAGFYRCRASAGEQRKLFNIGIDPEAIASPTDAQPDFDEFWAAALAELATVAPEYNLTLLPESNENKNIYLVTMKSLGGVEIQGYYAVPTAKGKHPAIITYMGYGSKPWMPHADGTPGYAEFIVSVRGQALNEPNNTYGDWIRYGLESKDDYYYRGAFMDLIRAIDFIDSRKEIDSKRIFAQGGSQGGAFTMAACALDSCIRAAAPDVPFLSDYPDYFRIVMWPAAAVLAEQGEKGLSNQELYATLSYFDIKNLAPRIKCPILMAYGLQDEVCPPHTNFSGYNQVTSPKSYITYPTSGHSVGESWWNKKMNFFNSFNK